MHTTVTTPTLRKAKTDLGQTFEVASSQRPLSTPNSRRLPTRPPGYIRASKGRIVLKEAVKKAGRWAYRLPNYGPRSRNAMHGRVVLTYGARDLAGVANDLPFDTE